MKKFIPQLLLSLLGSCLIYIATLINIPVPATEIHLSAQTLVIIVLVALLPKYLGVFAVLGYLIAGLGGIPVFSNSGHGIQHLLGPTGGYLCGFFLASIFISYSYQKTYSNKFYYHLVISISAHAIILFLGWLWLSKNIGFSKAFFSGVKPFITAGLIKSLLAALIIYGFTKKITRLKKNPQQA